MDEFRDRVSGRPSLLSSPELHDTLPAGRQKEFLFSTVFFITDFLISLWVMRPRQYYFMDDSWDVLYELLTNPRTIFLPHNEHFMPLFKVFYYLEYKVFGGAHLPYMIVGLALHAGITLLVYLLGRRLELTRGLSVAAALIFGFSSLQYEVTGWSFEQNFELSALLTCIAIYAFVGDPDRGTVLGSVVVLAVVAFWCGPIAVVLPPCLSVYYLAWAVNRRQPVGWWPLAKTLGALWSSLALMIVSVRAFASFSSLLTVSGSHPGLLAIPSMINFALYGTETLVLRSLTFLSAPSIESGYLVLGIFVALVVMSYRRLARWPGRANFLFLLSTIIFYYLLISIIRLQFGPEQALWRRYEYFTMVPLALLLCLCWAGLTRALAARELHQSSVSIEQRTAGSLAVTLAARPGRQWVNVCGIALLVYYLAFNITVLRRPPMNYAIYRGQQAQIYVTLAKKGIYPRSNTKEASILVPDVLAPPSVYPNGPLPLWKMFAVLERDLHHFAPIGEYLRDQDASLAGNLVRDGGFETAAQEAGWRTFGAASFEESPDAALHGHRGVEVRLDSNAAFSQDILSTGAESLPQGFYTFSIHAKTEEKDAIEARLIFKDAHGNILGVSVSQPHHGDGQWRQLLISGLSPAGTHVVGVDVFNASPGAVQSMLDDAILITYPGTVDANGNLHFAKPAGVT